MALGFKDFMNVRYRPGEDDQVNLNAKKRKRGDTEHEAVETEALSVATRLAKSRAIRRNKQKLAMGRKRAARKFANKEVLMKRTRRQVRNMFAKKLTKGIAKSELTPARKAEIEKRLDSPAFKTRIDRMALKKLKDVRKAEMERKRKK
jgi:hypothetical protein